MGWPRTVPKPAMTTTSTACVDEGVGDRRGVAVAVEVRAEAPEVGPVDQHGGTPAAGGRPRGPGRPVGDHQPDRQAGGQDGLEDGAAARGQHPDARTGASGVEMRRGHGRTLPAALAAIAAAGPRAHATAAHRTGAVLASRGDRTGATWPDRPASGTGLRRSVPPAQGMPLVPDLSAPRRLFRSERFAAVHRPPRRSRARIATGRPTPPSEREQGARRSRASDGSTASQNPHRGEPRAAGSGTATTRIRAALAEMAPLNESSTARQAGRVDAQLGRGRQVGAGMGLAQRLPLGRVPRRTPRTRCPAGRRAASMTTA